MNDISKYILFGVIGIVGVWWYFSVEDRGWNSDYGVQWENVWVF
tara:strand:+ start:255 stop:386 length:132 start_codon:yes stop_codon:yes gene_type:complete